MLFSKSSVAICGFAALARAHMEMNTPKPFAQPALQNGPLAADGSNFPCQSTGSYSAGGASNVFALGSKQPLKFTGQAVHGGGSCQVSITYDTAPTKNSVWRVIHSIEGGCPAQGQEGNMGSDASALDPYEYAFTIPGNIPTGNVTLAWTWFNKIGNREMYMNCAPVQLTGSSGTQSNFDSLPEMFTANIGNGCGTVASTDLLFPNPGDSLEKLNGATDAFASPTGTCAQPTGGSGSGSANSVTADQPSPTAQVAQSQSLPGGVFVTVSPAGAASTPASTPSAAAPPAATSSAASSGSGSGSGSSSGSGSGSSSGSGSGAMTPGSACSPEGEWNCVGGTSYQQCGSGLWTPVMPLAAGTKCTSGLGSTINIVNAAGKHKRMAVRFHG